MIKKALTNPSLILGILVILTLASCASHMPIPVMNDRLNQTYFTRYTLRGKQSGLEKELYNSNYLSFPDVIPVGTKVSIDFYSHEYIKMTAAGIPCRMFPTDLPFPTDGDGINNFLDKHFVSSQSDNQLNQFKATSRKNIEMGQAAIGMTKEEVLAANGYPVKIDNQVPSAPLTRERILESNQWIYLDWNPVVWWAVEQVYQFNSETGKLVNRLE